MMIHSPLPPQKQHEKFIVFKCKKEKEKKVDVNLKERKCTSRQDNINKTPVTATSASHSVHKRDAPRSSQAAEPLVSACRRQTAS